MTQLPKKPDAVNPADLLADLESRQDELLRLLSDLEERTRLALSQFGGNAGDQAPLSAVPANSQRKAA